MSGQAPDAPQAPAASTAPTAASAASAPPPAAECYEPFDPDYVGSLIDEVVEPLCRHYFRPVLLGAERLPRRGPLVLAPNHSGNAFPYDGMLLDALLWEHEGRPRQGKIRSEHR